MGRQSLLAQIAEVGTYDLWGNLNRRIKEEQVIPIISNAVVNNRIFDIDEDDQLGISQNAGKKIDEKFQYTIDEQLAKQWADFIKYPLGGERLQLARIAQYNQVKSEDSYEAKTNYLTFLKLCLLQLALNDDDVAEVAESIVEPIKGLSFPEIVAQLGDLSFSEIVFQMGYPKFEDAQQNPLYLLAQLPLPVFVTTSHHDFFERALVEVEKKPRVQVCYWFDEPSGPEWFGDPPDPEEDINAEPSESRPIVYHLYGLEKYPTSIVISEDDFMDFLIKVSEDRNNIPLGLRRAIGKSSLLLLGYRLRCWEFRALFRGIIKPSKLNHANFAIQLNPYIQQPDDDDEKLQSYLKEAQRYLEAYFEPSNFKVEWNTTSGFTQKLLQKWRESQR